MAMPTIYLVRHCSASGQEPDAPLTQAGKQQAFSLYEFFRHIPIERIISSDYDRAVESIAPLARMRNLPIETEPKLRERILALEPREDWLALLRRSFKDDSFKLPDAESGFEATHRILSVIQRATESGSPTIIVTHGNLLALLLQHIDPRFGFETWRTLSNPDVYQLEILEHSFSIKRIWSPSVCE